MVSKKKDLYTSEEKKKIKPNENCVTMFLKSNTKADNIAMFLAREYNRKVKEVPYNGKQTAYYLAKFPEKFWLNIKESLEGKSLESYIRNLYSRYSYGDIICLIVIALMWTLKITIVTPNLEDIKIFHNSSEPDIVVVHNGEDNLNVHYCATVGISEKWVPLQGQNHTHGIKCPTSVKTSVQQAEEHYLENKRNKLKSDFDFITSEMDHALTKVLDIRSKIDNMEKDLVEWCTTAENAKSKLIRLQAKMLLLGVDCDDVTKWLNLDPNLITPAYKKIISSTNQETTPTTVLVQVPQTTPSVTVSAPTTVLVQTPQTTPTTSETLSQLSQNVSQSGVVSTQSRATGSQTGVVDIVQSGVVSTAEAGASTVHQISLPVGMSATIP